MRDFEERRPLSGRRLRFLFVASWQYWKLSPFLRWGRLFRREFKELLRMAQRFGCNSLPRKHPADFARARRRRELVDGSQRAPFRNMFLHVIMMIRKTSDLRQMSDAEHLICLS